MALYQQTDWVLRLLPELRRPLRPSVLAGRQPLGLSGAQLKVLFKLGLDGPQAMGELARSLAISCPAATDLVDRLEGLQLVDRTRDTEDRRVVHVRLAPEAAQFVEQILELRRTQVEMALQQLQESERDVFVRGLTLLAEALNREAVGAAT